MKRTSENVNNIVPWITFWIFCLWNFYSLTREITKRLPDMNHRLLWWRNETEINLYRYNPYLRIVFAAGVYSCGKEYNREPLWEFSKNKCNEYEVWKQEIAKTRNYFRDGDFMFRVGLIWVYNSNILKVSSKKELFLIRWSFNFSLLEYYCKMFVSYSW